MDRRRYNQFCALATALDHVGDRWTLLVVRELLPGPRRYSDMRQGLPGIASNLLAARLHSLEADGVVARRRLPPPAASTVYELTDIGHELEPALLALMRWGSRWMTRPADGAVIRVSWFALALKALLDPGDLSGIAAEVELRTHDEVIHLRVSDGTIDVESSPVPDPDARITADAATLFRLGSGTATVAAEVAAGHALVDGGPDAVHLLGRILRFGPRPAPVETS